MLKSVSVQGNKPVYTFTSLKVYTLAFIKEKDSKQNSFLF